MIFSETGIHFSGSCFRTIYLLVPGLVAFRAGPFPGYIWHTRESAIACPVPVG